MRLALVLLVMAACAQPGERIDKQSKSSESDPHFLVSDGVGSSNEAIAYYTSVSADLVPDQYTLDEWLAENIGDRPTHQSLYRNAHELGFWREMKCTRYIGRGLGGCMVRNWNDPSEVGTAVPDLGTVTMNVSPDGFTRFYVFAPGGKLSPFAILDDEGPKFVPRVCIACHNGVYEGPSQGADLRAIFREFEPSMLEAAPGEFFTDAEWFALNQSVRSANASLRREAEGGFLGIDHPKDAQERYVKAMYVSISPPKALDVKDPKHLPPSWLATLNVPAAVVQAKKKLWTELVSPYCMTCHRSNDADWSDYSQFEFLALDIEGKPLIDYYIASEAEHDPAIPYMPQAKLLFAELEANTIARKAIDAWVAALGGPSCEAGMECTPPKECHRGQVTTCKASQIECAPTVPVADGTPCGQDSSCHGGVCTPTIVISIPQIPTRVYVRNQNPGEQEVRVQLAVGGGTLLVRQIDDQNLCSLASSELELSCNVSNLTCTDFKNGDSWKVIAGGTLERKNKKRPEVEGTYRIESPVTLPDCL